MLAYVDFFLGGDEKRTDLPPRLQQRFPISLLFGGDGSYMAPFSLHSDNITTSLMSQVCNFIPGGMEFLSNPFAKCTTSSFLPMFYKMPLITMLLPSVCAANNLVSLCGWFECTTTLSA